MLQRCTAGSRQHLPGHPNTWRCIILSPAPHPTESLTLSPRSPRFPGKPCGEEERYGQEGAWIRVHLRKGGTYCWPTIPFWPWAPIFTLQEGRDVRRVFSLGAPQHHPTPGTAAALAQRPVRTGTISLTVPAVRTWWGLWQYLPVVPGHHVHLWLLAAPPPERPARGRQELIPTLTAHSSSQSCQVPPPCQGSPHSPHTSLGVWHTGGCHVPPSRVDSAPSGVR